MAKIWSGREKGGLDPAAESFNSSISFDRRLYAQDIYGSVVHAEMLGKCGIITQQDAEKIMKGLLSILNDIDAGKLEIDLSCEDIHSFVEQTLTERIGDAGKRLHTARSRNDQVTLDLHMYLRDESELICEKLLMLISALSGKAEEYRGAVMPGYTHLQRAQPLTFGHWLLAYCFMFIRDIGRMEDWKKRANLSPIGACALAGTTYATDREYEAKRLGFDGVMLNSVDAVSDRDYCLEFCFALSVIMAHLSRLSEELILWTSSEFRFVRLDPAFTTGSSIMPQKRNPDMAELARGKCGRVYGDLMTLLTVMKGLPLAYDKDMQEDKEAVFDASDTVKAALDVFAPMIASMTADSERMLESSKTGFINATDLADYFVKKGMPFRSAYKAVGELVAECEKTGKVLEELPLETFRSVCAGTDEDVYSEISLDVCVSRRDSLGGTSPGQVEMQLREIKKFIAEKVKDFGIADN